MLQATVRDISDRIAVEKASKAQQERMIAASKMSSLGEMAGAIAHEINNPLTIIIGKANMIRQQMEKGIAPVSTLLQDLERIEVTAQRIAKIVRGLRAFSRDSDFDPMEKMNVRQVLEDTVELCGEKFKIHAVDLQVNVKTDDQIECRPAQISQVIMNLLNNAYDAVELMDRPWVRLTATSTLEDVTIDVTDCGTGIPAQIVPKIMQPFFTTKERGKGTGLGLSISSNIVHDHHGALQFDASSPNTRFVVTLPRGR
jgi:C4-dicarboxylate-specific signal transduction histidine kinase